MSGNAARTLKASEVDEHFAGRKGARIPVGLKRSSSPTWERPSRDHKEEAARRANAKRVSLAKRASRDRKSAAVGLLACGDVEANPGPRATRFSAGPKAMSVEAYVHGNKSCEYDGAEVKAVAMFLQKGQQFRCRSCHVLLGGSGMQRHPARIVVEDAHVPDDIEMAGLADLAGGPQPQVVAAAAPEHGPAAEAAPVIAVEAAPAQVPACPVAPPRMTEGGPVSTLTAQVVQKRLTVLRLPRTVPRCPGAPPPPPRRIRAGLPESRDNFYLRTPLNFAGRLEEIDASGAPYHCLYCAAGLLREPVQGPRLPVTPIDPTPPDSNVTLVPGPDGRLELPPCVSPEYVTPADLLDGRRMTDMEAKEFAEKYGGWGVNLVTKRIHYQKDRRLVLNRSVKETKADFVLQEVSFRVAGIGAGAIVAFVLLGIAMAAGLVAYYTFSSAPAATVAGLCMAIMVSLEYSRRYLKRASKTGKLAKGIRFISVAACADIAGQMLPAIVLNALSWTSLCCGVGALLWHAEQAGLFRALFRRRRIGRAYHATIAVLGFFTAIVLTSLAAGPGLTILPPLMAAFCRTTTRCAFSLGVFYLTCRLDTFVLEMLFPEYQRFIKFCPHMLSCVMSEYEAGTSAEVVRTNTRGKLLRLATLPIPDTLALDLMNGSEQVVYFLIPREPFFAAGPTLSGSAL